jgi:DNA-binding response OmpR family regulator
MAATILVVEDEAVTRFQLAESLRNRGYEVMAAPDGAKAIEFLNKKQFHLMITDFVVPHFDGFDLVRLVNSQWPNMPLIVVSGYLSESSGKEILAGLADFIEKPVDPDVLMTRVRLFLRSEMSTLTS